MSHDIKSAERPAPDHVLTAIADYALSYVIESPLAYETAGYCLMDTLACGFQALKYPACTKLMGPVVPGATLTGGARVPGTSYELDPINAAFNIGAMIRWLDFNDTWLAAEWGHPSDNLGGILAVADYLSRSGKPVTVRDVLTGMIKAHEIQGVLALENSFNRVGLDHVLDGLIDEQFDAGVPRQRQQPRRDLFSQHRHQGPRRGFEHDHPKPSRVQGRRRLGADEPPTDHRDHRARLERRKFGVEAAHVVEATKGMEPVARAKGQRPRPRARRDDDVRSVDPRPVTESHSRARHVEVRDELPQAHRHARRDDALLAREDRLLQLPLAHQHVLRERRPVIGRIRLVADQSDVTLVSLSPQGLNEAPAGEARAHHHHVVRRDERWH